MLKRLTSLEADSAEEFLAIELTTKQGGPDLSISVYEIRDAERFVIQARAEHTASFRNPPKAAEAAVSLHGIVQQAPLEEPGGTRFEFTQSTHRTIALMNEAELLNVAQGVIAQRDRQRIVECEAMRRYVRTRLEEKDSEWEALCQDEKRKTWRPWAWAGQSTIARFLTPGPDSPGDSP
jgi:hypothetical protein